MNVDITQIIVSIIGVILAIASTTAIPLIKNRFTVEQLNLLRIIIETAVRAAEQIFTSDQWKEKKQFVIDYLESKGFKANTEEINIEIEAAVLELHNQLYGTEKTFLNDTVAAAPECEDSKTN